ncbi:hypothetical protein CMI37_03255 [Candidatus Pacearchaeota archaeon]|nr:hypothetical protein [Candidatus Pacearchaeota archaeon]|tara:strand:+ start:132 stop:470 length:339 start_codon:yes stop_codon:yes gene_type:complete
MSHDKARDGSGSVGSRLCVGGGDCADVGSRDSQDVSDSIGFQEETADTPDDVQPVVVQFPAVRVGIRQEYAAEFTTWLAQSIPELMNDLVGHIDQEFDEYVEQKRKGRSEWH